MDKYVNQLTEVESAGNDDVIPIQPVGVTGLRKIKKSNLVTDSGNSALGTFDPSAVVVNQNGYYTAYDPSGNVTIVFSGTPKNGVWQVVEITLEAGETITIPEDGIIYEDSFVDGVAPGAGMYKLWIGYEAGEYQFILSSFTRKTTVAPSATSLSITGTHEVGETLTLNYTYNANDGGTESGSIFKWYRADDSGGTNEAEISGATASTYVLQSADNGKFIRASVTPSDGTLTGIETFSARVGAIDLPTLSTPTVALTPGDTELDYEITDEDAAATGGILTYDTNSDFSTEMAVPGYAFATKTGTITGLTNGVTYYVRLINTASGYNNSLPGSDSETPASGSVQLTAPTQSTPTVDSSTAITVTINDPNISPQESTVLFRRADDAGMSVNLVTSQQPAGTLTHQFTGLTPETSYYFDAIHEGNGTTTLDSDPSNVETATTSAGFSIDDLDNQLFRLTMNSGDVTITGSGISQANDVWNTNHFTQSTDGDRPTNVTEESLNWADFNSSDFLVSPLAFQAQFRSSFSVFMLVKPDDGQSGTSQVIFGTQDAVPAQNAFYVSILNTGKLRVLYEAGDVQCIADTDSVIFTDGAQSSFRVIVVSITSGNLIRIYVDGELQTLDSTNNGNMSAVTMGNFTSAVVPYVGGLNRNGTLASVFAGLARDVGITTDIITPTEADQIATIFGK